MMKKFMLFASASLFILAFALPAAAEKPLTPESLEGAKVVTAEQVQSLMDSGAKLYDVRKKAEYAEAHIPGAVSLPYKEKSEKSADFDVSKDKFKVEELPSDKTAAIIFQCNGERCWKSYKASVAAVKAGYSNVNWFRGGIPEWKEKGLPVE